MAELARGGVVIPPSGRCRVWAEPEIDDGCYIPLTPSTEHVARNVRIINEARKRLEENPEEV
jgi:hypothetical protein